MAINLYQECVANLRALVKICSSPMSVAQKSHSCAGISLWLHDLENEARRTPESTEAG